MKTKLLTTALSTLGLFLGFGLASLHAQGPLDPPPGPPGDTMKTVQEIYDKAGDVEAKAAAMRIGLGAPVAMEMVTVGNPGNTPDMTGNPNPAGAVDYAYAIGRYQVTNAQYAAFLNAVAKTDTHSLYNTNMDSDPRAGITRSGTSPNFTYAFRENMGDKPVNYVNLYDAARFCNWLHHGQPRGLQAATTTEDGAYTLTGTLSIQTPGSDPIHGANGRNAGARYHLPSEDEWYKAAYHEPGASGNSYWLYPTRSDTEPTEASADGTGNVGNPGANVANYNFGADWNSQDGNVTTVGSGGPGSASFYGAFDMGGNLYEWIEEAAGGFRGRRGGSWNDIDDVNLQSSFRLINNPSDQGDRVGFRVASP